MAALNALMVLAAVVGFVLLQVGISQPKNTSSIIMSNAVSVVTSCIMFWATGYAFAFGHSANVFLSHSRFFLIDATTFELDSWFFQFGLLSIYVTIANGGFAERLRFWIYPFLAMFLSGFVYPISTHWAWQKEGWLSKGLNNSDNKLINYQDVAGGGVIHISAGGIAVVAAVLLGPRPGRRDEATGGFKVLGGKTNTYIFLGGVLALFGLGIKNITIYTNLDQQSLSAVNTFLSLSTSALLAFVFKRSGFCGENWNVKTLVNAAIMGVVAVSAAPGSMHPYCGFAVGLVAGISFVAWNIILRWCHVDDISDTIAVNVGGGVLAVLAGPLLDKTTGVFYTGKIESFQKFGWNVLGCLVYFVWHAVCAVLLLGPFACAKKVSYKPNSAADEHGLDIYEHNEPAYPAAYTLQGKNHDRSDVGGLAEIGSFEFYGKPIRAHSNGGYIETNFGK